MGRSRWRKVRCCRREAAATASTRRSSLQRLYNQQQAAAVFNVGTLFEPVTRAGLNNGLLPRNLYSHSDQTQQWQSSDPNGGGTGWGGRVLDHIADHNTGALPPGINVNSGNALFLSGATTKGLNFSNAGSFGLSSFGDSTAMNARLASVQKLLTFDTGLQLISAANGVLGDSIRSAHEIDSALNGAPALPVVFPNSGLGQQLAQVAQIVAVQGSLGMNRQIFFVGLRIHNTDLVNKQQVPSSLDAALNVRHAITMRGPWTASRCSMKASSTEATRMSAPITRAATISSSAAPCTAARRTAHFRNTLRGPDDAGDRGSWIRRRRSISMRRRLAAGPACRTPIAVLPNLPKFSPQKLGFV